MDVSTLKGDLTFKQLFLGRRKLEPCERLGRIRGPSYCPFPMTAGPKEQIDQYCDGKRMDLVVI